MSSIISNKNITLIYIRSLISRWWDQYIMGSLFTYAWIGVDFAVNVIRRPIIFDQVHGHKCVSGDNGSLLT
jgi:hypothetical protein